VPSLRARLEPVESMSIQVRNVPDMRRCFIALRIPTTKEPANIYLNTVAQQIQEMQMVREKVYAMEQTHLALKNK
jgi:hypothetical protein